MRMPTLFIAMSCVASATELFADEPAQFIGQFINQSHIEIQKSQDLFDLNDDFTIEAWVDWQPAKRTEYFAGDEAWPGMSAEIKVQSNSGWVLRKIIENDAEVIDFTCGSKDLGWISIKGPVQKNRGFAQLVVARYRDVIAVMLNGNLVAQRNMKGVQLLPAETPVYLGPRKHGHAGRSFNGSIAFFRISDKALFRKVPFRPRVAAEPDRSDVVFYDFKHREDGKLIDSTEHQRDGTVSEVKFETP